jgi:acyl carrier protein
MSIEQQLRQFVNETFLFGHGVDAIGADDSFMERGIIDSTGVLELVTFIEARYRVTLLDEDLVPENLDSFNRLTAFVERKIAEAQTALAS